MFMFITLNNLIIVLMFGLCLILSNFSLMIFSFKIYFLYFFGDLEIMVSVWNFLFLWMVIMISSSVMMFSFSYMSTLFVSNFILLYVSFVFSMVWLILSTNFYWMMLGWDGLGVVSFLLILFYMNHESVNNGLFTLFQNRLGDMFFVLFIVGVISLEINMNLFLKWSILFLMLGSVVKSAQFPFNSWLLAAMSAPTPISSLVHSSTLVVAGVYILLQFSYCLYKEMEILKYLSLFTLIVSSFGLINEMDMKKLIAYSTMNHVGLMLYMMSMELYKVVYFHLNIHAMFKSMMFMSFGFVMLVSFHGQDKRLINLSYLNPVIKIMYYFSSLCLAGLPFLSGFFSKDFMLEKMMSVSIESIWIFFLILFLSISIYYSVKLMLLSYPLYSLMVFEKNFLGVFSIFLMSMVMILILNLYLTLMLSLSLEFLSMKLFVYVSIFFFFFWVW